ncbi:BURP domain protein RD22-like isoform X2 [Lotus japonicus]|uniref:BURP domain protein RD22-like isoform X2 n=1 Tax=Lotus japonicus TaxID=34305 RepID=UPI00258C50E4|nr:BURP domain protein RD22-like isoform X2 [Lotus japonicus]
MEPYFLSTLFSLSMMVMLAYAALPPQLYWKMMLPTTPVPKAITEQLSLGDIVSRGKSVNDAETQSQNMFHGSKEIPPQEIGSFLFNVTQLLGYDTNLYGYKIGAKEIQLHDDTNLYGYKSGASLHKLLHEKTKAGVFFFEENLHPGTKLDLQLSKRKPAVPILPRKIADQIPFSLEKLKEILEILVVKPDSKNTEIVEKTIGWCELPSMEGEEQMCATSLESLVDFIASKLGKNVLAISTEVEFEKETQSQNFLVKDGVKKLADDGIAVCHPMTYPYAVFFCHKLVKTSAYFVPLEGEDGARVKAVAVCHRDTSKWDPNHVSFQDLNVKPGTVPVCHVLPERHLLWVPK